MKKIKNLTEKKDLINTFKRFKFKNQKNKFFLKRKKSFFFVKFKKSSIYNMKYISICKIFTHLHKAQDYNLKEMRFNEIVLLKSIIIFI